jgi:hypothetical protein
MDLEQARRDLARALDAQTEPSGEKRAQAARLVLVAAGMAALGLDAASRLSLAEVIARAVGAPQSPARRGFAVLLVCALGVDGVVAAGSKRGQLDRDGCAFVETALPSVLQRAGYPFGGEAYERRRALGRLQANIDELLKPLEPTFPPRVQGLYAG